jgi:hypothetical protein
MKTTIELAGDLCIYGASHPPDISKRCWKKELVEYASGYGARADGVSAQTRSRKQNDKLAGTHGRHFYGISFEFMGRRFPFIVAAITTFFALIGLYLVRRSDPAEVLRRTTGRRHLQCFGCSMG